MNWIVEEKNYQAYLSKIDKIYIAEDIIYKHRLRIVHYANCDLPMVYYDKFWKLDFPWKINENTFKRQNPITYFIVRKILGIKCPDKKEEYVLDIDSIKEKYKSDF